MSDLSGSSIQNELNSGERLLWKGQPRGGIRFRSSDAFLIPFSLLWGGFAIFWESMALFQIPKNQPVVWFFPLFGVPFVLVGLYIIFGRFFVDAKLRSRTEYAVTTRRAIIVSGLFSRNVKSIDLRSTPEITLSEKSDKSGDIVFGATQPYGWWMQRSLWYPGTPTTPTFEMIEDVRKIYKTIEQVRADRPGPERG